MVPKELWLHKAKGMSQGMQTRVVHGNERRPNLVIGNSADRWWCYCQACKEGGVEMKEHVRLETSPEARKSDVTLPYDILSFGQLGPQTLSALLGFLAGKGMDHTMLPQLHYSPLRKRILIHTPQGWMGRDVTGDALEKWITYNRQQFLHLYQPSEFAVVVEDTFSMYKVSWALRGHCSVFCALGTKCGAALANELLRFEKVLFVFDGDAAGYKGAEHAVKRMRGLGVQAGQACAHDGYDPKDLSAAQLRALIKGE